MKKKLTIAFFYILGAIAFIQLLPFLIEVTIIPFINSNVPENARLAASLKPTDEVYLKQMATLTLLIYGIMVLSKKIEKGSKKPQKQGTSFMASLKDLEDLTGDDGFVLSKEVRLSADKSYEHVAIIGPTGSGKSSGFFIPNLLDLNGEISAVVTDPKGEMYAKTKDYLQSVGYEIYQLKPFDPKVRYNPVLVADLGKSTMEVKEISQLILINGNKSYEVSTGGSSGNAEWLGMSAPLLNAALLYTRVMGERRDITEAMNIILDSDLEELAEKFCAVPSALQEFKIFMQAGGSEKTMSSIKVTLMTALQLFTDPILQDFTTTPYLPDGKMDVENMFHPFMLRDYPCVLFVEVPERKSNVLMPLMSVIYAQLLDKCMEKFDENSYPILFMLDEFANIGVIPSIAQVTATCRSRKIGISLGLQGVEQLQRNYGEANASDILNNLKTKVVFSGLTGKSAEYVSQLAGFTTITTESTSTQKDGGKSTSNKTVSDQRRELLTQDEIRRMDDKKVLIIAHNKNIFMGDKLTYYNMKKYTTKLQIKKKHDPSEDENFQLEEQKMLQIDNSDDNDDFDELNNLNTLEEIAVSESKNKMNLDNLDLDEYIDDDFDEDIDDLDIDGLDIDDFDDDIDHEIDDIDDLDIDDIDDLDIDDIDDDIDDSKEKTI